MQTPPIPADEALRIEALRALAVLDTDYEERFDRLTRLAKRLFDVPIALVSLVDTDRQWFKSRAGLDATETSRDTSFCGHAIMEDDIFVVRDALTDDRFHDNPLVSNDPNIRFYAGCTLAVTNGSKVGTLCIIDRVPRDMTDEDYELLRDLAQMVEEELTAVQLATIDELTMISNRRGFVSLATHALVTCRRLDRPASLLYFDLDNFKQINDRFGHAEGDRALTTFARLLVETFRSSDVIGRLGGDEFAVLTSGSEQMGAATALDRLRRALDLYNASARRGYDLGFSVGSAIYDETNQASIDDLLAGADIAMFLDKQHRTPAIAGS